MRCADDSTSSIGALNQRSTLLRMRPLPTSSTSTAGISVIPEQHRDQLGAEMRKRQRAALLYQQLDDVAREHEHERHENREVRGGERVQDDLGQEVGRERRRSAGERQQARQRDDQHADTDEQ